MKSFQILAPGREPVLTASDLPAPARGEIRLKVAACGLNFADLLIAEGTYQEMPDPPFALGMELAGRVDALGPETTGPAPGTRVAAFVGSGGLAEAANVPAERCVVLPDAMPLDVAAGFQIAYGTSHLALTRRAALAPGETLLVLGAAGGVGLTAVEIGRQLGARVVACARGAEKLQVAAAAGADHLIDSATADPCGAVRALGGADVVFDPVGGDAFRQALRACRPEARILTIGFACGEVPQIPANHLLVKNVSVIGFYWGGYVKFAPEALRGSLTELFGWYEEGRLRPHIGHRLPLDRVAEGLALLRSRRATGKVVIVIDDQMA